jgi:hypothetical protein
MALTFAFDGRGLITNAESTTDWGVSGSGGISAVLESDIVLQGSYCVSCKSSGNKNAWLYYDESVSGTALDFSSGGAEEGELLYLWVNITTISALDTLANNAVGVRLGSGGTTNYSYWTLGGYSSGNQFGNDYTGGWMCVVIDPTLPPTGTGGTGLSLSNVSHIGMYIKTLSTVKAENLMVDTILCAKGLIVKGTDVTGWQEVSDYCTAYATRAYGMWQERQGIYFLYGRITLGTATQSSDMIMSDESRVFRFSDFEYYDGTQWTTSIRDDRLGLTVLDGVGNGTYFTDGALVGTDKGRNGSTFIGAENCNTTFDVYGGLNALSTTKFYGSKFSRITGGFTWGNDSDHHCYSVTFDGCAKIDPVGGPKIRNCIFQNTVSNHTTDLYSAVSFLGGTYTDETTAANNDTTNDMTLTSASPVSSDVYYFGSKFQFGSLDLLVSTVGSTFTVLWEYYGSGGWTSLSGVIDKTNHYRNLGLNRVSWTWPSDWAQEEIGTTTKYGPYYWVRANLQTTGGTQAKGQRAWINAIGSGAALKWNSNIDVEDCAFIANTHDENVASGIEHPATGSFSYVGLAFSGNDADVTNPNDATTVDSYDKSNRNTYRYIAGSTNYGAAQSITGTVGKLSAAVAFMQRFGSPTGNMYAKLYAITGTHGTDAKPTGSALATSKPVDVSTVSTSVWETITFEFEDEYTLAATNYCIAFEYTGGDGSNNIRVGSDSSSPTHGGNHSYVTAGSWVATSTWDTIFDTNKDGIVKGTNDESSNASTDNNIGEPVGATILLSSVTLAFEVLDEAGDPIETAQCAIYRTSDDEELMNEDTNSSGIATEPYTETTGVDIYWRVRKTSPGDTRYVNRTGVGTITTSGFSATVVMREDPNVP